LKNDDLLRDLKDIDRLARKVQADKQYTVEAADRELTEAKVSCFLLKLFHLFSFQLQMEIEHNHREMQTLDAKLSLLTNVCSDLNSIDFEIRLRTSERENKTKNKYIHYFFESNKRRFLWIQFSIH